MKNSASKSLMHSFGQATDHSCHFKKINGLNARTGDDYQNEKTHQLVGKRFLLVKRRHRGMARSQLHKNDTFSKPNDFLNKIH